MDKKFLLVMMGVLAVGIASILYLSPSYNPPDVTIVTPPASTPAGPTTANTPTNTSIDNTSTNTSLVEGPPGILPGKVVKELVPGIPVQGTITICNNSNESTSFSVKYRHPDRTKAGYVKASSDVPNWISISDTLPMVAAHSYKTITISILVPDNAEVPGEKWEFWIGVIDQGQTGMIQVELCQRWLVTML